MSCSLIVPFSGCDENIAFVIGIKRQLFYPRHSFIYKYLIIVSKKKTYSFEYVSEVTNGFEPMIRELQSHALPLG